MIIGSDELETAANFSRRFHRTEESGTVSGCDGTLHASLITETHGEFGREIIMFSGIDLLGKLRFYLRVTEG